MKQQPVIKILIILLPLLFHLNNLAETKVDSIVPEKAGFDPQRLTLIDSLVNKEIKDGSIPGAVVLVGRKDKIVFRKAFGKRNIYNTSEPMSVDTIFDLASITKPVATAASIWKLIEDGKIRLWDKVSSYIPGFSKSSNEKENPLRIYHLMTHTAGLLPTLDAAQLKKKYSKIDLPLLVKEIADSKRLDVPGKVFKYSCLGYITLSYIVEKVSGKNLSEFARENIFSKIGMKNTFFNPPAHRIADIAPTEVVEEKLLRGVVHDPLARMIGGISGNAGLFSTAGDLAKFAVMILNKGEYKGKRVFSPLTVRAYTTVYPLLKKFGRSPGWDVNTGYSSPRGDLFPVGSFGHSGFTGVSIWIDPQTEVFVIFLSSRVHPKKKKSIARLYSLIANIAASGIIKLDRGKK
jgi:CubicO group peptidase (beta-lactamase class C family)